MPPSGGQYLADRYPCDQGIASDPAVVWAENFEEGSVSAVTARYNDHKNPAGMALVADRPSSSCGAVSMQLTSDGRNSTSQATDLYKRFDAGHDELYWRWYVKYQAGVPWHHTGLWLGGYNPPSNWPNPQAGIRPSGNDRVSFAIETSKFRNKGQRKTANGQLGEIYCYETVGVQLGSLLDVTRHHPTQRRVRHVVGRVEGH